MNLEETVIQQNAAHSGQFFTVCKHKVTKEENRKKDRFR